MLVSVIFIFNVFVFGYSAETYDCRNGTVYLKLNEIAFFQTQNYPNFLSKLEQKRCDLMFASANGTNKVIRMVMAFYQFPVSFSQFPTFFSLSNDSLYDIRYDFPPIGKPIAEQGFFAFTDEVERCPLEFICKDKPFKILYENQILHIRSSYAINAIRQNPCQWKFVAPDGYGFKIVVQKFNISTTTLFKIENMTEIIANERSIRTNYAYYNSDSFIQIDLSKGDLNFIPEMEFQAYISIVKHSQEKSNTSCTISYNEDSIVWTNIKKTKGGYENNVQCFYELIIPPKSVVYVSAYYYVEKYIEYVKYYEVESNNSKIIDYDSEPNFIIDNYNESADKHVMFEFISDGNVQSYGFSINFEFIVCECSNIVAECYDNYYLMDIQSSIDEAYYCGNLECNIIIGKCSTSLTHIQFSTNTYVSTNDIFKIISNNRTVFEIIDWKNDNHIAYINSSAENIFLAITHRSSKINTLIISVSVFDAPQESKLILSDDNMTAIIDTALNPFTTIEMESKNQFFILYCPIPESIALYEDTSLTTPIKYCFIGDHPNKCIIKKNSFVIYSDLEAEKTYLTIRLSQSASNCVFGETTYFTNGVTSFPVSALSKKNESCIITILADDYYFITNLWTTSKNKNVKVFAGIDQTKLYFEFNYKTQKTWQHISMSSEVYTILIPPSAGFFIILEKSQSYSQSIIIADSQYKSLVPSLDFGCTKRLTFWLGGSFVYYSITVYPVIFTVLENTLTLPERFYFQINNVPVDEFFNPKRKFIADGKLIIEMKGIFIFEDIKEIPKITQIQPSPLVQELWEKNNKDFKIEVGNEGNVMVHKLVLSTRSTYFEGMLKSGMKEAITDSVKIIDFNLKTVKTAIGFFYDRNIFESLNFDDAFDLIRFSDKYQIIDLQDKLELHLIYQLSPSTVCKLSNGSIYSNSVKLREICFGFLMICSKHSIPVENLQNLDEDFAAELFLKTFSPFDF